MANTEEKKRLHTPRETASLPTITESARGARSARSCSPNPRHAHDAPPPSPSRPRLVASPDRPLPCAAVPLDAWPDADGVEGKNETPERISDGRP